MLRRLAFGAALLLSTTTLWASPTAKMSPGLLRLLGESAKDQDVLVYLKEQADLHGATLLQTKQARGRFVTDRLTQTARRTQAALVQELTRQGARFTPYFIANVIAVDGASPALIQALAARPDVGRILANPTVRVLEAATAAQRTADGVVAVGDNITRTGAPRVWSEFQAKGQGIVVAGQDTGIDWDHPALKRNYRGFDGTTASHDYHWHDAVHRPLGAVANSCGYDLRAPCDDHGHGTHTIGTAVGDDGRGNQIGMAPEAKWIGCRNMDAGLGKPSTYLECFQFFLAPWPYGADPMTAGDSDQAPDVMNNSWGCPTEEGCDGTEFLEVLSALKQAGIAVVAAAGNEGPGCATISDAPAHHTDSSFVVGAVDHRNGSIASFSSRGPSAFDGSVGPDLSAPGVSIRSAIPGTGFGSAGWSGTSMASPHVAGAVALLWSARPELRGDVDGTVSRFTSTAQTRTTSQSCGGVAGSRIPNNTYGHGILDVYQAVAP